jgi:hypothetical protein
MEGLAIKILIRSKALKANIQMGKEMGLIPTSSSPRKRRGGKGISSGRNTQRRG